MISVLVVEDNADLAFGLKSNLEIEGYQVSVCERGDRVMSALRSTSPDLLILDLMLPGTDGFAVLQALRAEKQTMPVLVLTARGEEVDKVRGLRLGADDYLTKPFGLMELLARIEALLRRSRHQPVMDEVCFGDIRVSPGARTAWRAGERLQLAPKEFDLLLALLRHNGKVVSRQQLMQEVWGHGAMVISRTVDTHIAELRRKIEPDPARPSYILTARKIGYRLSLRCLE